MKLLFNKFFILFIVNFYILCEHGNCVVNRTLCFIQHEGICVKNKKKCPFEGGIDMKGLMSRMGNICPLTRHCCVPPVIKAAFSYSSQSPHCGVSAMGSRIHRGFTVKEKEHPWQAAILFKEEIICGGSLIDPSWVISAAHCYEKGSLPSDYLIVFGRLKIKAKDNSTTQFANVKRIITHDFNNYTFENDIALFQLEKPIKLTSHVNVVCLPNEDEVFDNMVCMTSGFGINDRNVESTILLQIALPVVPLAKCKTSYEPNGKIIDERQVCAGYEGGYYDSCDGDSGGPFVCRKKDDKGLRRFILAGLTSFGDVECGLENKYSVYTRVSAFLPWINKWITPSQVVKGGKKKVLLQNSNSMCLMTSIIPILLQFILLSMF